MGLFSKFKTSTAILRKEEELLYAAVAKEMDAGIRNDALWLKALEQAGNEQRRVSEYIKLRVQALKDELHIKNELIEQQEKARLKYINSSEYKREQLRIEKETIKEKKLLAKKQRREAAEADEPIITTNFFIGLVMLLIIFSVIFL